MAQNWIRTTTLALAALTITASAGCSVYSADPITAFVVDAETKQPIEGANVVAAWELKGGMEGGNVVGYAQILETVTDKDGKFSFPGWGPKTIFSPGTIYTDDPGIILFKDGYEYRFLLNQTRSVIAPAPHHMSSPWDGKSIPLKSIELNGPTARHGFTIMSVHLETILRASDCNWKSMVGLISAITSPDLSASTKAAMGDYAPDLTNFDGAFAHRCPGLKRQIEERRK
jgi:hypothetical protein